MSLEKRFAFLKRYVRYYHSAWSWEALEFWSKAEFTHYEPRRH